MTMRRPNKKFLLIGIFVVSVIVIASVLSNVYFVTASVHKKLIEQKPETKDLAEDFNITEYEDGRKNFTLEGKKMQVKGRKAGTMRVAFGKVAEIDGATVVFYEGNKEVSTLMSPKATINLLNKEMTFYGKIDVITQDKRLLTSNEATWNNDEKCILAKGNCILDAVDGRRITGDFIKTDIKLEDYNAIKEESKNPISSIIKLTGLKR